MPGVRSAPRVNRAARACPRGARGAHAAARAQGSTGGSFGGGVDVANRGQIRFYRKGPAACAVKLTISYEVPDALAPLAGTLRPIVENILRTDLGRFAALAAAQQGAPAAAAK